MTLDTKISAGQRPSPRHCSGNSKYHYYGIQVKSSSPLVKQMPFDGDLLLLSNAHQDFDFSNLDTQSVNLNMSPNEYVFSPLSNHNNSSIDFPCPDETFFLSDQLPPEITIDDMKTFQRTHDDYTTKLFQAFVKFQYDSIEKLTQQFWSLTNVHSCQATELTPDGTYCCSSV